VPTIEISKADLEKQLGKEFSLDEIKKLLPYAKCEYDGGDDGDLIKADCKDTNRPDLWCVEGIARQIRGALGKEIGLPKYKIHPSNYIVRVNSNLKIIRPRTACAVVKGIKITNEVLKQIIQMQEKVAGTFGRNRKEAAIGVYDFDKIKWPVIYQAYEPDTLKFIPLEMNVAITLRQILVKHPKGREFAHLLEDKKMYPIFIDSAKNVLSMPPVINSNYSGKVTSETKNLFIEVSGFQDKFVHTALNAIIASLADRGGEIHQVKVKYNLHEEITCPIFAPKKIEISTKSFNEVSGFDLTPTELINLIKKARMDTSSSGDKIIVYYPTYRQDVMHERDIIEDALISYGYNNIETAVPKLAVIGEEAKIEVFARKIREFLAGFGAQEIITFTLTNKDKLFARMLNLENQKCIEIANPVSQNWSVLRNWLTPSVVEFLSNNTKREFPQRIFEVGNVIIHDSNQETKTRDVRKLCYAVSHNHSNFTEIKQVLQALLNALYIDFEIVEMEHNSFIPGRAGAVKIKGHIIGFIGELHPQVLKNWRLEHPTALFELDVDKLLEMI
jgi:phenylalanyl-tRNA synthetase beta chain